MKTKNSFLSLTKTILITFISLVIFSCSSNIPTNKVNINPYIVTSILTFTYDDDDLCIYKLETGVSYIHYRNNISVIDSIGKFNIGDSVVLSLNKY